MKIKFVSYDGEYPNLCRGKLTLEIDGKQQTFGYTSDCDHDMFWTSGGSASVSLGDNEEFVSRADWQYDYSGKDKFIIGNQAALMDVFNSNVRQGCCGGCI